MKKKRDWFDELVHDLKTPLAAAKGFIDLVQNLGPLNDEQQKYVDKAMARLDYMHGMINQLLELAPLNKPLPVSEVNFDHLLVTCVETVNPSAAQRGITIYVDTPPGGVGTVWAETHQLDKVLLNLLNNAVKYNIDQGVIDIRLNADADNVWLSISDTGLGIALEEQDLVFERFYRAHGHTDGTGLGLSIVKTIVEKHGGRVELVSEVNKGTTITVVLPRHPKMSSQPADPAVESVDLPPDDPAEVALVSLPRAAYLDRAIPDLSGEALDPVDDDSQEADQSDISDSDRITQR
jgi:signal transduction histidine kinase